MRRGAAALQADAPKAELFKPLRYTLGQVLPPRAHDHGSHCGPHPLLQRRGGHCAASSPTFAPRCRRLRSTSMTTTRATARPRSRAPPARSCGASALQGKGHVVRRMFADIEADLYVLVDGDDTYDADSAPELVRLLCDERLDMVTGARVSTSRDSYRRGHRFGNAMFTGLVRHIFGDRVRDMLSGYRVFSRRFVKSFPGALGRVRDRDRAHGARARTRHGDRRNSDAL